MGDIDPVLVSILQKRLKSVTDEMGLTLLRTGRSPILSEARDFVTGLYDARGRMLEQTEYIPVLAFALAPVCARIIDTFGKDIHPGDVILHNDVFSGGNQNNDVAVFKPVFFGEELVAWAACKGHQADIGGNVAGGYNPEAREVWQEAFRIPPVKVFSRGRRVKDVWNLIFANVRLKIVEEDIEAQIGACVVGERAVGALIEKYGLTRFCDHIDALFDATERMVRHNIAAMPDGSYRARSCAYYDGVTDGSQMHIELKVEISGERITFDFSGSSAQTPGFVNAPYAATASAVLLSFLMMVDPHIPHNDGLTRTITIVNPKGSFLNAAYPAATTFGNSLTGPTSDAIFKAFAEIAPKIVTAGWNRMLGFTVTGADPGDNERFVDILFIALKGGSGAALGVDGYDHIGLINCAGGILAQDYEMMELQTPNTVIRHEYGCDSAGGGEWRGGLGVETELEFGGDDVLGVAFGDGVEEGARAFGLFGGTPGSANRLVLTYPDGTAVTPKTKQIIRDIPRGTRYLQVAGGGGGYGDPLRRDAGAVRKDVVNGVVSVETARDVYGVCIDAATLSIDEIETSKRRRAS